MILHRVFACLLSFVLLSAAARSQPAASLRVTVTGKGKQALILIPGFTCSGAVWSSTVAHLAGQYRCYVVTFAGFAGEPAQSDPHLKSWVADVADYITSHQLDKPIIIGHSIGGGIAMMLAAGHPELVSRVIVVDALPCLSAVQHPAFKADPGADCSPFVSRYISMSDSALFALQTQTMPMLCTDTSMRPELVRWTMQSDRKTMGQIYCEFLNTDLRDTIAGIKSPVFIMLEAPFKMYDAAMQEQYSKLRNKQIAYATKGLHFIMYDDKDWYLQQLDTYLAQ